MDAPSSVAPLALPLGNYYWVLPGRVLAGEHPAGGDAQLAPQRLESLLAAGIRCFIDLTRPEEFASYAAQLPADARYFRKPIRDHGTARQRRAHMGAILDQRRAARCATDSAVYLHCRAGIGRTGMAAGCLLAERGRTGEEAIEELNRLWQQSARSRQLAVRAGDRRTDRATCAPGSALPAPAARPAA